MSYPYIITIITKFIEYDELKLAQILGVLDVLHVYYFVGRGGYINEGLVEDDAASRIIYTGM